MSEEEKMEKVFCYVQKLRLPLKAVAEYLLEKEETMPCPMENIRPGMFVYEDNTFRSEVIDGLRIKAVVGYVEGGTVYAVCLKQEYLPWSSEGLRVSEAQDLTDGADATLKILECANEEKRKAEAAQWCHDYEYDGVKKGEAFLPSVVELMKLGCAAYSVSHALKYLTAMPLKGDYLSSTEFEEDVDTVSAVNLEIWNGWPENGCDKAAIYNVRPMIKIAI